MNLNTLYNQSREFGLDAPGRTIKQRFMDDKRQLQLAVKKLHDALVWDGTTSIDNEFVQQVQMVELLLGLSEENFRDVVRKAVDWLTTNEDEAFWDANAHGVTAETSNGSVLFKGEYLLLAGVREVLAK